MTNGPKIHHRRSIRLREYDYAKTGAYFVTICTQNRECVFGEVIGGVNQLNELGKIVHNEWIKTEQVRSNVKIDEFIIMPNHFHGIVTIQENVGASRWDAQKHGPQIESNLKRATRRVAPTTQLESNSLGSILGQFKSLVTKKIRKLRLASFKWQRNYYEHIIRNENDLNKIRDYIRNNPMNWEKDENHPIHFNPSDSPVQSSP